MATHGTEREVQGRLDRLRTESMAQAERLMDLEREAAASAAGPLRVVRL